MKQKRRGLLLFLTSCIPGCGQMHQGYMKRGLSLMMVFWGIITITFFLNMEALLFVLCPTWLYAFFDSYNLHARLEDGTFPQDDDYLFSMPDLDAKRLDGLYRQRHTLIGWLLVALGVYMLYDRLIRRVLDALQYYFEVAGWLYSFLFYDVPRLIITFGIIALGVWFIRGPKKPVYEEDIPDFTPPVFEEAATPDPASAVSSDLPVTDPEAPEEEQEDSHGEA